MSATEDDLLDLIVRRAERGLSETDEATRSDTYVVSFWVDDDDDDPRPPRLVVGVNTEERVRACTPAPGQPPRWPVASSEGEARWNYAFWHHDDLAVVGGRGDPEGRTILDDLFGGRGLRFDDDDWSDEAVHGRRVISATFLDATVRAADRLHRGPVERALGRDLPVLVHDLEYDDAVILRNIECNPPDLIAPFVSWHLSETGRG